ncbi:MAG TPA: hypothetical protein VMR59_02875 [Patescibacteria group bacterium]|nr:hypothetical protein [Patescibacteria group bacterium]
MKKLAYLLGLVVLVIAAAGCTSTTVVVTPAPTMAPVPTPVTIYVTPAPTIHVTPAPTMAPTASPTESGTPFSVFSAWDMATQSTFNADTDAFNAATTNAAFTVAVDKAKADDAAAVKWLGLNPPMACYSVFHADLLLLYNADILLMNDFINHKSQAVVDADTDAENTILDRVDVERVTASAACS